MCVCVALSVQKNEIRIDRVAAPRADGHTKHVDMYACAMPKYIHTYIHTYLRHVSLTHSGSTIYASGRFGVSPPTLLRHAEREASHGLQRDGWLAPSRLTSPRVSLSAPMAGR